MIPKSVRSVLLLVLSCAWFVASHAAEPTARPDYIRVDNSTSMLIDKGVIKQLWVENTPPQLQKLYPRATWGMATEVNGGFDEAKTCIVTARAMLLPRRGRALVLDPKHASVAFGALPGATQEQCQDLARTKLRDAIQSVVSSVVAKP